MKKKRYEFTTGAKVAIFTYQGCVLSVEGKTDVSYISRETPMVQYLNCHAALEQLRVAAEEKDERGPIAMIVGPMDVGKSTLARIFLNYAVRMGRRPLYVDIDVGQGAISIPGSMATVLIERPASVEEGFSQNAPLVYHFGHNSPGANNSLYKAVISKMAEVTLNSLNENKRSIYIILCFFIINYIFYKNFSQIFGYCYQHLWLGKGRWLCPLGSHCSSI